MRLSLSPLSEAKIFNSFPLNEKFCGLSGLSGLVPNYENTGTLNLEPDPQFIVML